MPLLRITPDVVMAHLLEDKSLFKQIKKYFRRKTTQISPGKTRGQGKNLISKLQ